MIEILSEPRDESYRGLLALAAERCSTFTLVLKRPRLGRYETATATQAAVSRFAIEERRVVSWGGTTRPLGSAAVTLGIYRVCSESIAVLRRANGLYDWCLPHLPEDLNFYRENGDAFLLSIAHERRAMLPAEDVTEQRFREAAPDVLYRWRNGDQSPQGHRITIE